MGRVQVDIQTVEPPRKGYILYRGLLWLYFILFYDVTCTATRARHARPDYSFGSAPDQSQHLIDFRHRIRRSDKSYKPDRASPTPACNIRKRVIHEASDGHAPHGVIVLRVRFLVLFCFSLCSPHGTSSLLCFSPYLLRSLLSVNLVIPLPSI